MEDSRNRKKLVHSRVQIQNRQRNEEICESFARLKEQGYMVKSACQEIGDLYGLFWGTVYNIVKDKME